MVQAQLLHFRHCDQESPAPSPSVQGKWASNPGWQEGPSLPLLLSLSQTNDIRGVGETVVGKAARDYLAPYKRWIWSTHAQDCCQLGTGRVPVLNFVISSTPGMGMEVSYSARLCRLLTLGPLKG